MQILKSSLYLLLSLLLNHVGTGQTQHESDVYQDLNQTLYQCYTATVYVQPVIPLRVVKADGFYPDDVYFDDEPLTHKLNSFVRSSSDRNKCTSACCQAANEACEIKGCSRYFEKEFSKCCKRACKEEF